jgi:hypothetical protein
LCTTYEMDDGLSLSTKEGAGKPNGRNDMCGRGGNDVTNTIFAWVRVRCHGQIASLAYQIYFVL